MCSPPVSQDWHLPAGLHRDVRKVCFALSADPIMSTSCAFLRAFPALILCVPVSTGDSSPCLVLGKALPGTTDSAGSSHFPQQRAQSQPLCGSPRSVWVTADRTVTSRPAKAACLAACDIQPLSHWALQPFFSKGIFIAGAFLLWIAFPCPAALQSINSEHTWVLLKAPTTTTYFAFLPPSICFIFKDIHWSKLYILPTPTLCFFCNFCLGDSGQPRILCFPVPQSMLSSNSWEQQKKME